MHYIYIYICVYIAAHSSVTAAEGAGRAVCSEGEARL